jgi:hypothetical protein
MNRNKLSKIIGLYFGAITSSCDDQTIQTTQTHEHVSIDMALKILITGIETKHIGTPLIFRQIMADILFKYYTTNSKLADDVIQKCITDAQYTKSPMIVSNAVYHTGNNTSEDIEKIKIKCVDQKSYPLARCLMMAIIPNYDIGSVYAKDIISITHYDYKLSIIAHLIHNICYWGIYESDRASIDDIAKLINDTIALGNDLFTNKKIDTAEYLKIISLSTLDDLQLNEHPTDIPLKAFGCVIWALKEFVNYLKLGQTPIPDIFTKIITSIIMQKGNAVLNTTIVGGCLGVLVSGHNIDAKWINGTISKSEFLTIKTQLENLCSLVI